MDIRCRWIAWQSLATCTDAHCVGLHHPTACGKALRGHILQAIEPMAWGPQARSPTVHRAGRCYGGWGGGSSRRCNNCVGRHLSRETTNGLSPAKRMADAPRLICSVPQHTCLVWAHCTDWCSKRRHTWKFDSASIFGAYIENVFIHNNYRPKSSNNYFSKQKDQAVV